MGIGPIAVLASSSSASIRCVRPRLRIQHNVTLFGRTDLPPSPLRPSIMGMAESTFRAQSRFLRHHQPLYGVSGQDYCPQCNHSLNGLAELTYRPRQEAVC